MRFRILGSLSNHYNSGVRHKWTQNLPTMPQETELGSRLARLYINFTWYLRFQILLQCVDFCYNPSS